MKVHRQLLLQLQTLYLEEIQPAEEPIKMGHKFQWLRHKIPDGLSQIGRKMGQWCRPQHLIYL